MTVQIMNAKTLCPSADSFSALLAAPTHFLFFTGKGGVGKTSLACASAIALADGGRRVLLVSTDPASNLDEVLGARLTSTPTDIPGVPRLAALNIDPAAAAAAYREKLVGPYRGQLPAALLRSMEEQLSGACTMEIAAFDEFSRLLGEPAATAGYDHVIFDTAPTGHTLRLLSLPGAWTGFLARNTTGNSCLGPLAGLGKQRVIYENAVAALADSGRTTLVLVTRAQRAALAEAERTSDELAAIGVRNQRLILNGLFQAAAADPIARALEKRGADALATAGAFLNRMRLFKVPLLAHNLVGLPALRALTESGDKSAPPHVGGHDENTGAVLPATDSLSRNHAVEKRSCGASGCDAPVAEGVGDASSPEPAAKPNGGPGFSRDEGVAPTFCDEASQLPLAATASLRLSQLVDDFARAGQGVIMTMGKGGVGKTTIAAAIATELARRGFKVHLSTTDPAAHIAAAAGKLPGMQVSRIDPQAEMRAYVGQVMATAGKNLDAGGRALLAEDLRSPCTEEIAVFRAFARTVAQGKDAFVVLDTAPTGHTLLLLDATESYHREIARKASDLPEDVRQLLPRLRDRDFTRMLIVTLPEATPVHEAAMLQADLRRAQIEPFAWIINQSFADSGSRDPLLVTRGRDEAQFIREVVEKLSQRTVIVPWVMAEPTGPERLQQLFKS
jgi:arsenite-transporting ATPase